LRNLFYTQNTDDVEHFIYKRIENNIKQNINYKLLHLTPTLILFRKRNQFYKKFSKQINRGKVQGEIINLENNFTIDEFFHWTNESVYKENSKPLSRNESHVITKRAINEVLPGRIEWVSSSFELMELFQYFQTLPISIEDLKEISPYDDWVIIIEIYKTYLQLTQETGLRDYSQALMDVILSGEVLKEFSEVIMDGPFLFFEPIHEALINKCEQLGIPLSFIVPFEKKDQNEINPAFKIIQKIYGIYVPETHWVPIGRKRSFSSYLDQIPSILFTDQKTKYDDSITFHRYNSLEQEVIDVVSNIKRKIDSGYSSVNKIAIVTPNSKQLRPLVREIAESVGIEVEVPERPFLGLTAGEFVQFIYKIRTEHRKFEKDSYIDKSIFKRILISKWFNNTDLTILSFDVIEDIFFEDIVSILEWTNRFNNLLEIKQSLQEEEFPFHPLNGVLEEDIITWIEVLNRISRLQDMIFSLKEGTIAQHATNLLDALKQMVSNNGQHNYMKESKIIDRIENIIEGLSSQDRIEIMTHEFGDLLNSLFLEQEDTPEGLDDETDQDSKGILVTSLQNIVFQKYNYIYTIQFTQDNYPMAQQSRWPLHNDIFWKIINKTTKLKLNSSNELERLYTDREKYYFYLSFVSAKIAYGISYSRFEQGIPLSHSHYLSDIAKTFGVEEENLLSEGSKTRGVKIEELLQRFNILKQEWYDQHFEVKIDEGSNEVSENIMNKVVIKSDVSLDDIAIYKLCPKRYGYMKLLPKRNVYTTSFQITMYLANELFIRVLKRILSSVKEDRLVEEHQNKRFQGKLLEMIPLCLKDEIGLFSIFPVNDEVKENAIYYATMFVENYIQLIIDKGQLANLAKQGKAHASIMFDMGGKEKEIEVGTENGKYTIKGTRDFSVKLGNFPIRTYSLTHRPIFLNSTKYDLEVHSENSISNSTYSNWLSKIKREFFYDDNEPQITSEIGGLLQKIEKEEFKKQKGSHCSYCPFYKICLEKESIEEEYDPEEGQEIE
jgi:ATP-dependent helicase/nuclease subunit B